MLTKSTNNTYVPAVPGSPYQPYSKNCPPPPAPPYTPPPAPPPAPPIVVTAWVPEDAAFPSVTQVFSRGGKYYKNSLWISSYTRLVQGAVSSGTFGMFLESDQYGNLTYNNQRWTEGASGYNPSGIFGYTGSYGDGNHIVDAHTLDGAFDSLPTNPDGTPASTYGNYVTALAIPGGQIVLKNVVAMVTQYF